jgi:hypothetical protein
MIKLQATGYVLNPRCPEPTDPRYGPRTYFEFQSPTSGKLSLSIQGNHVQQLTDVAVAMRPVVLRAGIRATTWDKNQKIELLDLGITDYEEEKKKQPA